MARKHSTNPSTIMRGVSTWRVKRMTVVRAKQRRSDNGLREIRRLYQYVSMRMGAMYSKANADGLPKASAVAPIWEPKTPNNQRYTGPGISAAITETNIRTPIARIGRLANVTNSRHSNSLVNPCGNRPEWYSLLSVEMTSPILFANAEAFFVRVTLPLSAVRPTRPAM